ncbi:MAG TPA: hydantoinase/oxoprolinase family protein [Acetobacteraceae bacterium]|nr:hydantoinase/oxoprolinase family protein [Acetobacteraceae bacterium]
MTSFSGSRSPADIEIGVDTGGTFTDIVCRQPDLPERLLKVPSTPGDPSDAIIASLRHMTREWGIEPQRIARFVHGTTVGTNAVLEEKGAHIGLLTTEGFGDVLEIGRQIRDPMYATRLRPATPGFLLPGSRRKEINERVDAAGRVLVELDADSVRTAAAALVAEGVEAIAVCYLFSFLNPAHEIRTRELIVQDFPQIAVSLSSEVDPNFREYERTVVTAFDAYIKPVIGRYLERLETRLRQEGVQAPLQLMQSRGGVAASVTARRRPVRLFLSGPAGGVIGGRTEGARAGETDLITIDIGGTSSDIALIAGGAPLIVAEGRIGRWPVRVPMVGVHAIGAGGGSIARVDAAGGIRVGPQSAGADPGPACYGKGGAEATVTDASLVLGYLDPEYFAGGAIRLDPQAARRVIAQRIADPLGLSLEAAAIGIHRVINAGMAEGIRLVSIQQGYDPRRFALVALGGAGPVHALALADELSIGKVVVPPHPGVLSAAGLLAAPIEHEVSATFRCRTDEVDEAKVAAALDALDRQARALMEMESVPIGDVAIQYSADLCYVGQSHFLEVPLALEHGDVGNHLCRDFVAAHERVYGHATEGPVTIVSLRSTHRAAGSKAAGSPPSPAVLHSQRPEAIGRRPALFRGNSRPLACDIYHRDDLRAGMTLAGPAIIEQTDTTTIIEPDWVAYVAASLSLILTRRQP